MSQLVEIPTSASMVRLCTKGCQRELLRGYMSEPKKVLYFAENALSAIQGGGIVAYAVLKGLPAENLLGFYEYRNITPVPEYADRFIHLGPWRTPQLLHRINKATKWRMSAWLLRRYAHRYVNEDLKFVEHEVARRGFEPEVVYFAGLSYRYLRLANDAAERYGIPMVILHMDDWMAYESQQKGRHCMKWNQRIAEELKRGAALSLASTSNSPRLAERLTRATGHRHVAANNCCSDLTEYGDPTLTSHGNDIPVITYAGAMNMHLQGETLNVLASAVSELNAEGTPVHLHIYTPWEFAPHANAIAVPGAVFYKGQVGRERLADIYRQSDFLVTTVTYRPGKISLFRHSLSTKLSEYLCAGKPVISMGHFDWHLQEYVQENGCGFSIQMDENFSRAKIKEQLRAILATDRQTLARIGRNNRALWERAHDVRLMSLTSRRAVGLDVPEPAADEIGARGALWVGDAETAAWVPLKKAQLVARRLVDVFELETVDIIGNGAASYPELSALRRYCQDIGLRPALVSETVSLEPQEHDWDLAATRWSLAEAQCAADDDIEPALNVFEQVYALRGTTIDDTAIQRVLNQLSVRVGGNGARPLVWMYGSAAFGLEIIQAIENHAWLGDAVEIGGFLSSSGHCRADLLHGYRWMAVDTLAADRDILIVIASENSRLAIMEELSRANLLDRSIAAYGTGARRSVYERELEGPGQQWVTGFGERDYATAELSARLDALAISVQPIEAELETSLERDAA